MGMFAMQLAVNSTHTYAASATSAAGSPAAGVKTPLGLTVTSHPHQLEIRWNRDAATILSSEQGVMKITEGGVTEGILFDPAQLRDGFVAYTPMSSDVNIRLEVTGQGGTTSESIRAAAIP